MEIVAMRQSINGRPFGPAMVTSSVVQAILALNPLSAVALAMSLRRTSEPTSAASAISAAAPASPSSLPPAPLAAKLCWLIGPQRAKSWNERCKTMLSQKSPLETTLGRTVERHEKRILRKPSPLVYSCGS